MDPSRRLELFARAQDIYLSWGQSWLRDALFGAEDLAGRSLPRPLEDRPDASTDALIPDPEVRGQIMEADSKMRAAARRIASNIEQGGSMSQADYDAVMGPFWSIIRTLRRLEQAFAAATGGLDPLTGLKTRARMEAELDIEFQRYRRTGQPFCLALCDLDHFKNVNDTHGHQAGDAVLIAVATMLVDDLRTFDDAYRHGGEEFVLVLKNAGMDTGMMVVERLRERIEQTPVMLPGAKALDITASFGIVAVWPQATVTDMIAAADSALYTAKRQGRNRVERADGQPVA